MRCLLHSSKSISRALPLQHVRQFFFFVSYVPYDLVVFLTVFFSLFRLTLQFSRCDEIYNFQTNWSSWLLFCYPPKPKQIYLHTHVYILHFGTIDVKEHTIWKSGLTKESKKEKKNKNWLESYWAKGSIRNVIQWILFFHAMPFHFHSFILSFIMAIKCNFYRNSTKVSYNIYRFFPPKKQTYWETCSLVVSRPRFAGNLFFLFRFEYPNIFCHIKVKKKKNQKYLKRKFHLNYAKCVCELRVVSKLNVYACGFIEKPIVRYPIEHCSHNIFILNVISVALSLFLSSFYLNKTCISVVIARLENRLKTWQCE